jgi:hypothetical protein
LSPHPSPNQRRRITSLLHRDLRHPGQRIAVLIERCGVTDQKISG